MVLEHEGTVSGGKVAASASVTKIPNNNNGSITPDATLRRPYKDPEANDDDLFNSATLLQQAPNLYDSILPTFVVIYYMPRGATEDDYGITF
jgi:hypothetical protein